MPTENTACCRECGRHWEMPGAPPCGHDQAPDADSPLGRLLASFKVDSLKGESASRPTQELT